MTRVRSERLLTRGRMVRATAVGALVLVLVGVPTDVIATPLFGREIPVRWWEYPVLVATAVLTAAWFAMPGAAPRAQMRRSPFSAVVLSLLAVGCPVCNKLILLALGTTGALSIWQPVQPLLAVVSVGMLGFAVRQRWRRRNCLDGSCTAPRAGGVSPDAVGEGRQPARSARE